MALAPKLATLLPDLAALADQVTYRMLADQLKAAIALAQANGLAAVSVTLPSGTSLSYPSLLQATQALALFEASAAEETGAMASAQMNLQ
jgi:hypothetical protein